MFHVSTRITKAMVAGGLASTALLATALPAQANTRYTVTERDGYLNTGIRVNAGERVQISATSAQIWSGVWFSGWNGPMGWTSKCNSQCPLPGERAYSLLVQIGGDTQYVGSGALVTANSPGEVVLKINDDRPNNGAGYFEADVTKVG